MADPIRVVVVEDHTLVREGLVTMLDVEDDIEVVAEAGDGDEALRLIETTGPDLVLLDLRLPGLGGLDVLREVKTRPDPPRVVVLTVHDEQAYVAEALRAGADGYLLKTVNHAEVADAVRRVMAGDAVLHPGIARTVVTELSGKEDDLSVREIEVLQLLAQGLSNREIAERISLGVETVKTHISHILAKLDAVDRTQAVAVALRKGIID